MKSFLCVFFFFFFEKSQKLARDVFETSQRGTRKDVFFEMYVRRLKDITKSHLFEITL